MTEEIVKQIISFVFKRNGKGELSVSDFYLTLSMQLQWCEPLTAKQFVQQAIQDGFLMEKSGNVKPKFQLKERSVPIGFKPFDNFFQNYKPKQSSLDVVTKNDLLDKIASETSRNIQDIQKFIDHISKEKMLSKQVSLLLFAKKMDVDITVYFQNYKNQILKDITD